MTGLTLVTVDDLTIDWELSRERVVKILRDAQVGVEATGRDGTQFFDESAAERARAATQQLVLARTDGGHNLPVGWTQMSQEQRDSYLSPEAIDRIRTGIPRNTWETYQRAWQKFCAWCERTLRTPLPVTEHVMVEYVDFLSRQEPRPAPSSLWIWYSAVRFMHKMGSPPLPWECGKRLELAIKSYITEMIDVLHWTPKKAPRAFPSHVQQMVDKCDRSTLAGLRDASILLVGFLTAARASHMGRYRIANITRTPGGMDFYLARSKNDQLGKGMTFPVARNDDHPSYCPVRATEAWLAALAGEGFKTGALYRPVNKHGSLGRDGHAPAFQMTGFALTKVVRKYAILAKLGDNFTMHSLRRGYATWLREIGFDLLVIARAFDWSPHSKSYLEYLEEAERWADDGPALTAKL